MPPSADQEEEEELQEETLQKEDQVHLDLRAVEELHRILQQLLHKCQSQRRLTSKPWAQPHGHSWENETKQRIGLISYEDIIVVTASGPEKYSFVLLPL